jgi:hypothetical protein
MITFVTGFCNIKAGRHKKSQKELAKTRFLKLSKTSRIVTAFSRHNTESQMVTIVTGTMRYRIALNKKMDNSTMTRRRKFAST